MLGMVAEQEAVALRAYLQEALGGAVELRRCPGQPLPVYLAGTYELVCGEVLGVPAVFALLRHEAPSSPAVHAQHLTRLSEMFDRQAVLVAGSLSSRDRQRLVERGLSFVVPFTHMFLPWVGVDFRERVRRRPIRRTGDAPRQLAPTTQLVLLHALLRLGDGPLSAQGLTSALAVSAMSISRALRELEEAGLMERLDEGRKRPGRLVAPPREVWEKAQPFLASPVRSRHLVLMLSMPGAPEAGLSALSRMSELVSPPQPTVALSAEEWRAVLPTALVEPFRPGLLEDGQAVVEVWSYAPRALSAGPTVDVLSLYLTLRDTHDERVEAALQDALRSLPW